MRLLLDTHSLVWHYQTDPRMSAVALAAIKDPGNEILVSAASYWEVAIKLNTQKPNLRVAFDVFVQEAIYDNGFVVLPIEPRHASVVAKLPLHHSNPFDRILVAQSISESIPLVSRDPAMDAYGVSRVW